MTAPLTQALNDKISRLIKAVENDNINDVMDITNKGRSLDVINGIPINVNGQQQFSPVHTAVELNKLDILKDLLDMGADPDIGADSNIYYPSLETTFGVTPLFMAIYTANLKAVQLLLTNGADINHHIKNYPAHDISDYYETVYLSFALSIAPQEPVEMYKIVDYILTNYQPNEDIYKTVEYPTIIGTIEQGLYELAELLLKKYIYANPNEIEIDPQNTMSLLERRTALMVAIGFSPESNDLVDKLLRHGANPNNNIGFEYTIEQVLHPETLHENDYVRQSHDFSRAKDDIGEAITDFVSNYNRDPQYNSILLVTALNYALAVHASNVIISALITYGGLTTRRILHNEGLIVATGASLYQQLNKRHLQKIRNIPNITPEQYKDCVETMGSGEILSDFITAEDVPIENTVILPSSDNNKTCMDRNSYGDYIMSRINSRQPIIHPYTREKIMTAPNYQTWYDTNYPLGFSIDYSLHRSDNNTKKGGKRKHSKSKQTQAKRRKTNKKKRRHKKKKYTLRRKK
jgi:ankyrin repeat protein